MRIFVVETDGAGGLIHYAYQLCDALSRAGEDVTLVTGRHYELADLPHSFSVEARVGLWPAVGTTLPASRVLSLLTRMARKVRRVSRGVRYAVEWHRLTNFLIAERPDIVQFSSIHFPFQAYFLGRLRRAGLTLTQICHEFEPRERGRLNRALAAWGNRFVFDRFDLVYLHGENNRSRFHELFDVPRDRTRSIPHGNESMFLSFGATDDATEDERPIALFFGGLRPSKGIDDLIDAWEQVRYEVDAKLLICGEPEGLDPAELVARTERVGVSVSVEIDAHYQPMDQVAALMKRSTVVVLPYRNATASGVLQLAYAFGTPVVATARGALAEDVEDGTTGLLVEPGDVPGLARALVKILSDRDAARQMGEAAARASKRFGWDPIAAAILDDYQVYA